VFSWIEFPSSYKSQPSTPLFPLLFVHPSSSPCLTNPSATNQTAAPSLIETTRCIDPVSSCVCSSRFRHRYGSVPLVLISCHPRRVHSRLPTRFLLSRFRTHLAQAPSGLVPRHCPPEWWHWRDVRTLARCEDESMRANTLL
jgi:hypothetical protein